MKEQSTKLPDNEVIRSGSIYFDNAATSFPKPPKVVDAVVHYLTEVGANPGRAGHQLAVEAGMIVFQTRRALADLFGLKNPMKVIFTSNATEALNLAINGVVRPGDHVITTSMEHNSTMRPLKELEKQGTISLSIVKCSSNGLVKPQQLGREITDKTRVMVVNHASNVLGSVQPIREIGKICKQKNVILIADCAQSGGIVPIDINRDNIDILAVAGHKGLYGPSGTGAMLISDDFDYKLIKPLKSGGTGSLSDKPFQPDFLPDCFESGTLNVAGLGGLLEGVRFLQDYPNGIAGVLKHKKELQSYFIKEAESQIETFECFSKLEQLNTGVVAFRLKGLSVSDVAQQLSDDYDIMCRQGLHCAPLAHETMGTFPEGTLRFGFGLFNSKAEIDRAVEALKEISQERGEK